MAIYAFQNEDELAEILMKLGDRYFDCGEYDKSYIAYYKAIKHIQSPRGFYNLGILELKSGNRQKGRLLFQKAMDLAKGHKDEVSIIVRATQRLLENEMISKEDALEQVDYYLKEADLSKQEKDEVLAFLCWYYKEINEIDNSITSFLQIQNLEIRKNLLDLCLQEMVKENKWNSFEPALREIKDAYPYEFQIILVKAFLLEGKVQEALNVLNMLEAWKKNRNEENINEILCYKTHAYLRLKQVIMAIDSINRIDSSNLSEEDAYRYDAALCQLAQLTNNYTKEEEGYEHMIDKMKKKYRKMELGKVEIYEGFF
ncbi:MAG: hypothetical protein JW708_00270 [Vallitaleaceae bacterium]|nr:hypothetical protein [Vallitaleaceae bacterium]